MTDPLQHFHSLSARFLRTFVETPIQQLFGRPRGPKPQVGASPGTLFIATDAAATRITLWRIDGGELERIDQPGPDEVRAARDRGGRLWLDVVGFADQALLLELGELFGLHPVTLADLVNIERQTKVDALDDHALILMQVLHLAEGSDRPGLAQLGLVLLGNALLSFRERPGPLFDPVLARLERPISKLRSEPLDYLACAVLNVAVEASFPVVEMLADQIDSVEERVMEGQGQASMSEIHSHRRVLIMLGRLFWRQRDLLARLLRDEEIFRQDTQIFLRDVYDGTVQLLDMVETTRELAASLVEIHLSISANRSNQIMQTLTIIASIFIPLTFIAGVYGMNFEVMPELSHPLGYPAVLALMLAVSVGLLLWFRRRGWLGQPVGKNGQGSNDDS
jgi:magnesium transporter